MATNSISSGKDAAYQFISGGCAGLVEVCLMHPLDLVKTRFQVQRGPEDPNRYKGIADCFRKIYRTEGALSFYKGILPPILAETPKRATKFLTFEQYKKVFNSTGSFSMPVVFSLSGFCAGLTEAVVVCPFEVVKMRLQTERALTLQQQKSAWSVAREIMSKGGFGSEGLYRGLNATLMRHGWFNGVYFGFYHSMKQRFPLHPQSSASQNFAHRFVMGFSAGFLACTINTPFDVAKSRIQGPQPDPSQRKYFGCTQTLRLVHSEEGFWALYKGFVPKTMRLAPGGAIMFIVFDTVYDFLKAID